MSTFRYGDGTLYGASGVTYGAHTITTRRLTWAVLVDWDNDGVFDGSNEAAFLQSDHVLKGRLLSVRKRGGREFIFNSSGDGFIHFDNGTLEMDMLNEDGRYDPYNESSPLNGMLYKNQAVRVILKDEVGGTQADEFNGYIRDIRPTYGAVDTVTIYVDGAGIKLQKPISSSSVYTTAQYDTQIGLALTAAGWTGDTDIDTTVTDSMPYHWFDGQNADIQINELADAAFGLFWVTEAGTAKYISRVASDASTQTLTEDDVDASYGVQVASPRDVVKNRVRVYSRARRLETGVEIWRMNDAPQIATGTGTPIWAEFNYNGESVPATSVTTPAATTDYTAFANADGTGTNYTANISLAVTNYATKAKIIPTNSSTAAYLTLLKLRGNAITADKYTYSESEDSTSISTYGLRELVINSNWLQDYNAAAEYADIVMTKLATPRPFPRFKFKRSSIGKQIASHLGELVNINFATRSITGEFRVGYREMNWSINDPNVIDTVVYLEPNLSIAADSTWIFPTTFPTIFT